MALSDMINQEMIRYATYLFKLEARMWWNLTSKIVNMSQMSQSNFRNKFKAKYRGTYVAYIKA